MSDAPHRIDVIDGTYAEGVSAQTTTDDRYEGGVYGWFCIEGDDDDHLEQELKTLGFTDEQIAAARTCWACDVATDETTHTCGR